MGLSRGSCVYQPLRPKVSHSMSYPLAILIQVKRDCGIPFFCSSNDGLCVGSTSVVICSLGAKRSRASTSCQTHRTTLRPAKRLAKNCLLIILVSIMGSINLLSNRTKMVSRDHQGVNNRWNRLQQMDQIAHVFHG